MKMVSKGVDYYYYAGAPGLSVQFKFPADWGSETVSSPSQIVLGAIQSQNHQINMSDIGYTQHYGNFTWTACNGGASLFSANALIAPSTGNLGGGSLANMMRTPSQFINGVSISYGFYDAGAGNLGLTNQDQAYVYVTPVFSQWMTTISRTGNINDCSSFGQFVLPGAHDAGTFDVTLPNIALGQSMDNIPARYKQSPKYSEWVSLAKKMDLALWLGGGATKLAASQIAQSIVNMSVTQKDDITTMLNLGIRCFDFRPGYIYGAPSTGTAVFHQHTCIPGYSFLFFLEDVLAWLKANPGEIVVVCANNQGFADPNQMTPTAETLQSILDEAMQATGTTASIVIGSASDMNGNCYDALVSEKKRLVFLNQFNGLQNPVNWHNATCYDSYTTSKYETTNVNTIIEALNAMNRQGQQSAAYTMLQLQGTALAASEGVNLNLTDLISPVYAAGKAASQAIGPILSGVLTRSESSAPLMSTKASFDMATYPWCLQNVHKNFLPYQLVVLLNDFADNALVQTAINLTIQRMETHLPPGMGTQLVPLP